MLLVRKNRKNLQIKKNQISILVMITNKLINNWN